MTVGQVLTSVVIVMKNKAYNLSSPDILQRCKKKQTKKTLNWELFEIHIQWQI